MILIVGLSTDPVLQHMVHMLTAQSCNVIFIDQQRLGTSLLIDEHGIQCLKDHWHIKHAEVSGVLNRMVGTPTPQTHSASLHHTQLEWLSYLLDTTYPKVLNRPNAGLSNGSKPYQLTDLPCVHLRRPESTVMVNLPAPSDSDLIFKSISSTRSIVKPLQAEQVQKHVHEPVLFQKRCEGQNVRVHTVAKTLIAVAIASDQLDYRYQDDNNCMQQIALPHHIEDDCFRLSKHLDLPFSGIDLIQNEDQWTLLEVNPAPGYNYFEHHLPHTPISDALAHFLNT